MSRSVGKETELSSVWLRPKAEVLFSISLPVPALKSTKKNRVPGTARKKVRETMIIMLID